jgi:hypothetical protein
MFRGQNVTDESAPVPYDGIFGGIQAGQKPTKRHDIEPGQWMTFDFPTKDIREFKEGDKMHLSLTVSLEAGAQHYERKFEFTKTLVKSQLESYP